MTDHIGGKQLGTASRSSAEIGNVYWRHVYTRQKAIALLENNVHAYNFFQQNLSTSPKVAVLTPPQS